MAVHLTWSSACWTPLLATLTTPALLKSAGPLH
jgi:hypothetical protein